MKNVGIILSIAISIILMIVIFKKHTMGEKFCNAQINGFCHEIDGGDQYHVRSPPYDVRKEDPGISWVL